LGGYKNIDGDVGAYVIRVWVLGAWVCGYVYLWVCGCMRVGVCVYFEYFLGLIAEYMVTKTLGGVDIWCRR